jgi:hypothetical protein
MLPCQPSRGEPRRKGEEHALETDEGRLVLLGAGLLEGCEDVGEAVISIVNAVKSISRSVRRLGCKHQLESHAHQHLPVIRFEPLGDVLSEGESSGSIDGNVVVIVDGDQVAELEVTRPDARNEHEPENRAGWSCEAERRDIEAYPASEAASEETPSIRHPSPVNM